MKELHLAIKKASFISVLVDCSNFTHYNPEFLNNNITTKFESTISQLSFIGGL